MYWRKLFRIYSISKISDLNRSVYHTTKTWFLLGVRNMKKAVHSLSVFVEKWEHSRHAQFSDWSVFLYPNLYYLASILMHYNDTAGSWSAALHSSKLQNSKRIRPKFVHFFKSAHRIWGLRSKFQKISNMFLCNLVFFWPCIMNLLYIK